MLYLAYGSNLNVKQMLKRCPAARKLGGFHLRRARLVFRSVADIEYDRRGICPGGLWEITKKCEEALDRYEGVEEGLYSKTYLKAQIKGQPGTTKILVYQMNSDAVMPPGHIYLDIIAQGYQDFGLDLAYLDAALARSWDDKMLDDDMRERRKRRRKKDGMLASCVGM